MKLSLGELAQAVDARLVTPAGAAGAKATPLPGRLVIDSRQVRAGDVFVALPGSRVDGHAFVPQAFAAGAAACVVRDAPSSPGGACLVVDDPRRALHRAGEAIRKTLSGVRMVAVTGSCGKTSTKEFVAAALRMFGKTRATEGNLNNDMGVPLTLSAFEGDEMFGVIEEGMNAFGEIDFLSRLVQPEVGVVTSIFPAHLEGVGSLDGVRRAKGEMAAHVRRAWVVPAGEDYLVQLGRHVQTFTFGDAPDADLRLTGYEARVDGGTAWCATPAGEVRIEVPAPGRHQALNALAALAAVHALGLDVLRAAQGIAAARLPGSRSRLFSVGGVTFFDDSYNASPGSLKAVLEWVAQMRTGEVHLVVGDMLELGAHAEELHRQAGMHAARLSPRSVFYVGEYARAFSEGLGRSVVACAAPEQAADELLPQLAHGDFVLIKASHGIGLHRTVERLLELTSCACT